MRLRKSWGLLLVIVPLTVAVILFMLNLRQFGGKPSEHAVRLATSFEHLHTLEAPGAFHTNWSPDSNTLVTASQEGRLTFWDVATGQPISSTNEGTFTHSIKWAPDGKIIALDGYTNTIRLIESSTYRLLRRIIVPTPKPSRIYTKELAYPLFYTQLLGWLPNTHNLISLDTIQLRASTLPHEPIPAAFTDMHLWDADTGNLQCTIPLASTDDATNLVAKALSPDGRTLATVTQTRIQKKLSNSLKLWDVTTCQLIRSIEDVPLGKFDFSLADGQLAWSPDGSMLAFGADNLAVNILNVSTGEVERSLPETVPLTFTPTPLPTIRPRPTYPPTPVSTIPEPVRTDIVRGPISTIPPPGFTPSTPTSIFSPTSSQTPTPAPTPTADKEVYSWILRIAWSPDGRTLLVHDWNAMRLWDTATGKLLHFIGSDSQSYPQWSPDGRLLISSGSDNIMFWDPVTGSQVGKLPINHAGRLAWSPNGRAFAVALGGTPGKVEIWGVKDNPPSATLNQVIKP